MTTPTNSLWDIEEKEGDENVVQFLSDGEDDLIWFPPVAENPEDDVEGGVADLEDDDDDDCCDSSKWSKSTSLEESRDESSEKRKSDEENQRAILLEDADSKFKLIVSQLIESAGFSMEEVEDWMEIVTRLCWEAASLLKPAIDGKQVDPTEYIKVKCIATGSCNESEVFKGLVFRKHAAHKHMATKYEHPRIMLVEGVLGQSLSGLSSFNSMGKDMDYVAHVVAIIEASKPDVMLVEKSVSRDIQMYLLDKKVTLVSDMNLHRLQRISRCIGSPIFSSDSLSSQELRHCDSFRIEKITEEHNGVDEAEKKPTKTLMFLEGTRLGCTILLKGSHSDRLKKVKQVVKYSVLLAYNLILEASFLAERQTMFSTIFTNEAKYVGLVQNPESVPVSLDTDVSIISNLDYIQESAEDTAEKENDINTTLESQSILVLFWKRNALTGIMCDQSRLTRIKFYDLNDVPLERFLRDMLNQSDRCQTCDEFPEAHLYYYTGHNKQLTIQIKRIPVVCLYGEAQGKIWMWSRCGTQKSTKRVMMSTAARSLSFGKFLELSFSQKTFLNRLSSCGHSFHRDFVDFFGLGSMVAMLSYSQVTSYTMSLPRMKLEASIFIKAGWLEKEFQIIFTKGISLFEDSVTFLKKLRSQFTNSNLNHQSALKFISNTEDLLKHERCGFEENIKVSFDKAKTIDDVSHKLLRLNHIRWELLLQALIWNYRLQSLVLSDRLLPSSGERKRNEQGVKTIGMSNEQEADKSIPVTGDSLDGEVAASNESHILGWDEWFWLPFEDLRSKPIVDVEREFLLKFESVNYFTKENLQTVSQIITEEGSRLRIPLRDDEFIVSDYEDELSSLIACALAHLSGDENRVPLSSCVHGSLEGFLDPKQIFSSESTNRLETLPPAEVLVTFGSLKSVGKPKYSVVCLYADDFRELRKRCCSSELDYIASLSRCEPWDAKGGKSKSVFAKTLDDRFIVKEIKKTEYESFVKFAPEYFKYMRDSYDLGDQTCLAKVLGIHQVTVRQPKSGKEIRHDLMVMENLSFGRKITRQYDLKGSLHARFTATCSANDAEDVLLDKNFVNDVSKSPLYVSQTSKHNLSRAVYNDTRFLTSINVMDYSLLVGVDDESHELVCGIINYLTQYTWEKQLETWVKSSFVVPKNVSPTVISPIEYRKRFRKFMNTHFLCLPDR